jgi:hypothetical protein
LSRDQRFEVECDHLGIDEHHLFQSPVLKNFYINLAESVHGLSPVHKSITISELFSFELYKEVQK